MLKFNQFTDYYSTTTHCNNIYHNLIMWLTLIGELSLSYEFTTYNQSCCKSCGIKIVYTLSQIHFVENDG